MRFLPMLLALSLILSTSSALGAECTSPASDEEARNRTQVDLYQQLGTVIKIPWIISRGRFVSSEEKQIDGCSQLLSARTISDSLPERINVFAHMPFKARSHSFVAVSTVDMKMAMEKTGPYWHTYDLAFPDLRFVGAISRSAHGLVTLDPSIQSPEDLRGKNVGLVSRPSSLRALEEIVLIMSWDINDDIIIKEYIPQDMPGALDSGEVDAIFMPVASVVNGKVVGSGIDINRTDLRWLSLSVEDIEKASTGTPVVADRVVIAPPQGATNGDKEVGLISFDSAWFTFASAPDEVVYEFLRQARHACSPRQPNCGGRTPEELLRWADLSTDLIHPGALRYYQEIGAL